MSEQLARKFHEIYERLAPSFGYETRTETRAFEPTTPNGRLMIAVTDEIENELQRRIDAERKIVNDLYLLLVDNPETRDMADEIILCHEMGERK